jgi:hypothetical protein
MFPKPNSTLRVVVQTGAYENTRIARLAHNGTLFGSDTKQVAVSMAEVLRWEYASVADRQEFDACLRDHMVPPTMSVVVRRATVFGVAPAATPALQSKVSAEGARYSFVDPSRRAS